MGDVVIDIDTMFDWDYLIAQLVYCFGVPAVIFELLAIFFVSPKEW